MVVCYADGGCSPNPGPGGWGVVILDPGGRVEMRGGEASTTNNRMELTAAVRALERFPEGASVEMRLDSRYVVDAMTQWVRTWKRNGWRTATGEVKNQDLVQRLDALASARRVRWTWVKGHSGQRWNERADALVHRGRREAAMGLPDGLESFPADDGPGTSAEGVAASPAAEAPPEAGPRAASVEIAMDLGLLVTRAAKAGGTTPRAFVEDAVRLALALGPDEVRRLLGKGEAA